MERGRIGIMTDCGCDLNRTLCEEWQIDIVHFLIQTDTGIFMDGTEITAGNMVEYMLNGGKKAITSAAEPEVYRDAYLNKLRDCESVIFITLSAAESESYRNAVHAAAMLGDEQDRVHVLDSKQLSTGQGLLVLRAAELAQTDLDMEQILTELEELRERISTSFITENADFLYMNGRVNQTVRDWCRRLSIHPVLAMKNGSLTVRSLEFGNYEHAGRRYLKKELRHADRIDHCACENLIVTNASAAISCNCGKNTFGVLFIRKKIGYTR